MRYEQKALEDRMVLTLSGELTLPHAAELKTVLTEAIGTGKPVKVAFTDVEEADLSLVQLLCAAHRTALSESRQFGVDGTFPDPIKAVLGACGFYRHRGCALSKNERDCLWIGSED